MSKCSETTVAMRTGVFLAYCNGHHRISVAKLAGQVEIEAAVAVWHTAAPTAPTPATPWTPAWPKLLRDLAQWCRTFNIKGLAHAGTPA